MVFHGQSGRLRAPHGGYTAGEMLFLGPRTAYQIDTSPHGFAATFEIGPEAAAAVLRVDVSGSWLVVDPVAVVAHRVSDLEYACTTKLVQRIEAAMPPGSASPDEVRDLLRTAWKADLDVPGGIRLGGLQVEVTSVDVLTGEKMIQLLITDEDDGDPADPASAGPGHLIQEIQSLAEEGLAALTAEHGDAALDSAVGRALVRFSEMVARMDDVLPPDGDRSGDDPAR